MVLLALLPVLGFLLQSAMDNLHTPAANALEQASEAALAEDWYSADALLAKAQQLWEKNYDLTAAVADHAPMEEVDTLFAELAVYSRRQEAVHFASTGVHLARLIRAVGEAHRFDLRNIL